MNLHELSPAPGSNPKAYRKGRGHGSGNGKTVFVFISAFVNGL